MMLYSHVFVMREIVLDTETTGLSPSAGHRLVDIGCVELIDAVATGVTFQRYINPQRDVPKEAVAVHGLDSSFLQQHPPFDQIAEEFLAFIGNSTLVIHNAKFDLSFLNAELQRLGVPPLTNTIVDTVQLARQKFPGSPANLDALCKRFQVDLASRTKHGAIVDAVLLAKVYPALREKNILQWSQTQTIATKVYRSARPMRHFKITEQEERDYISVVKGEL
jgi:DNA polymerase III subunit epsilon